MPISQKRLEELRDENPHGFFNSGIPLRTGKKSDRFSIASLMGDYDVVRLYEEEKLVHIAAGTLITEAGFNNPYPRFAMPKQRRAFQDWAYQQNTRLQGQFLHVMPSEATAHWCREYVFKKTDVRMEIGSLNSSDLYALTAPVDNAAVAQAYKLFSQHTGLIISARTCVAAMQDKPIDTLMNHPSVSQTLRQQVAQHFVDANGKPLRETLTDIRGKPRGEDHVYLAPTGMSAIFMAHQAVQARSSAPTCQFGYAYYDTPEILKEFGDEDPFLRQKGNEEDYKWLEDHLRSGKELSAIFLEFPSNPDLKCHDLARLSNIARAHNVPLVIDITMASAFNVDVSKYADLIVESMTKAMSGHNDVMGGYVVANPSSPLHYELEEELGRLEEVYVNTYFIGDARVMAGNMRGYEQRMVNYNLNALMMMEVFEPYIQRGIIKEIMHPSLDGRKQHYAQAMKPGAGFGGVFSVVFADPAVAWKFYNEVQLPKGPSLYGYDAIVSPYMALTAYPEADRIVAEELGQPFHTLRISAPSHSMDARKTRRIIQSAVEKAIAN